MTAAIGGASHLHPVERSAAALLTVCLVASDSVVAGCCCAMPFLGRVIVDVVIVRNTVVAPTGHYVTTLGTKTI